MDLLKEHKILKKLLRKCNICGKYTLIAFLCPFCGGETRNPHPAKFSLEDKYLKYRIKAKKI